MIASPRKDDRAFGAGLSYAVLGLSVSSALGSGLRGAKLNDRLYSHRQCGFAAGLVHPTQNFGGKMAKVGDGIDAVSGAWTFAGDVASNFDSHVKKSVPMYDDGHNIICDVSDFFVKPYSNVYEVGCSTGTLISKLAKHNQEKAGVNFFGIDLEEDMIDVARRKVSSLGGAYENIKFISGDIKDIDIEPADLIVSYYTIQFIPPSFRQEIINKIYNSLNWGGGFLFFEKVRGADARFQDMISALYVDYKLRVGYSANDIIGKSRSLKGVLEPFSTQGNLDMLDRAGFRDYNTVFKYLCFEGVVAIK